MNNFTNTSQGPLGIFGRWWNFLTAPHPSITDVTEQRASRLAASFLFTIAMLNFIGALARVPSAGMSALLDPTTLVPFAVLIPAYFLARTKWYRVAVFIFAVAFSSLAYIAMISQGSEVDYASQILVYVPLSLVVASAFVSPPTVFLLVGLNVGAYFSIQAFGVELPRNIGAQVGILTVIGLVIMLLNNFRNTIEKIRLDELREANREMESLTTGLEQRVAERTQALATVSEISTAASTILEINKLLHEVVNLSKERFGLYHAHIYLLDDAGEKLVLVSGAGEAGRQMVAEGRSIPLEQEKSLVARAARERRGVIVNDVTLDPDFLPNPLLPDTHAELAVPMLIGDKVIGVFDVQSELGGRFTEADVNVQTTLAAQIASAIQNARSYTEISRSQALLADSLKIARLGNWEYNLEKDTFTFNDQFYSVFRTTAEDVGGYQMSSAEYASKFVHPDDAQLVGSEIKRALTTKERFFHASAEHRTIFPNGEIGYITVNITVERDENGKIIRWYGANQDITERRQLEELTRQRADRETTLNLITQKIQSTTSMREALQITARELGQALGKKPTLVSLDAPTKAPEKEESAL